MSPFPRRPEDGSSSRCAARSGLRTAGRLSATAAAIACLVLPSAGALASTVRPAGRAPAARSAVAVEELSISDLRALLSSGRTTSERLVRAYLARMAALDRAGPRLRSVIAVDPTAIEQARRLDREAAAGRSRGPLHGIPVLVKDNVEVAGLPTTAGSLALSANDNGRDAPLIARLRAAGAVVLGKTNLSEWANFRSTRSTSGWSAVGGLVRNPHALDRSACGSSSGSGAAVAASLAAAAVGTETNGSISCPASMNGIVGFKPTVGLVSRSLVVPISATQDTAGPLARGVADAALLLEAMQGSDPTDPATRDADAHRVSLDPAKADLRGVRIGVASWAKGDDPGVGRLFERALADLRRAGAVLVELPAPDIDGAALGRAEMLVLETEFKAGLDRYLASTGAATRVRSLSDLIAFDALHADAEMPWFGQELLERAQRTTGQADPDYLAAVRTLRRVAGTDGLEAWIGSAGVEAIVAPTAVPAFPSDLVNGDHEIDVGVGALAAMAGLPHLSVPMGEVARLPVGLSFVGSRWADGRVLELGLAYERASRRRPVPTYAASAATERPGDDGRRNEPAPGIRSRD